MSLYMGIALIFLVMIILLMLIVFLHTKFNNIIITCITAIILLYVSPFIVMKIISNTHIPVGSTIIYTDDDGKTYQRTDWQCLTCGEIYESTIVEIN